MNRSYNMAVICPQSIVYKGKSTLVTDLLIQAKFLLKEDGYMTLGEYEKGFGYDFPRSEDGRYIVLFVSLSDVLNEFKDFKSLLVSCGVKLGGSDYSQTSDGLAFLLTLAEYTDEFLPVSPLFTVTHNEEI